MSRQVIAGADLAGRRAARQAYDRPWVQSQTPSSACIRNRPALQTSSTSFASSSCIRNRPALQVSSLPVVKAGKAQGPPRVALAKPIVTTASKPAPKLPPSSSKPLQSVSTAVRKSLPPVHPRRSSTPCAMAPKTRASALTETLAEEGPQLKSALRKEGTASKKRVSWGGKTEWATYTKGMKTKFYDRELLAALVEEGDDN